MKIYINTTDEILEINGELFIPGEWMHLPDDFKIPDFFDEEKNLIYPIKTAQEILEEKLSLIPEDASLEEIASIRKELGIDNFIKGIEEAGYGD